MFPKKTPSATSLRASGRADLRICVPAKAHFPTLSTLGQRSKSKSLSAVPKKASSPISCSIEPSAISIEASSLQPAKARLPIFVTLEPSCTEVSERQSAKALSPISLTFTLIPARAEALKALSPIRVTFAGMEIDCRLAHAAKAASPISVSCSGRAMLLIEDPKKACPGSAFAAEELRQPKYCSSAVNVYATISASLMSSEARDGSLSAIKAKSRTSRAPATVSSVTLWSVTTCDNCPGVEVTLTAHAERAASGKSIERIVFFIFTIINGIVNIFANLI